MTYKRALISFYQNNDSIISKRNNLADEAARVVALSTSSTAGYPYATTHILTITPESWQIMSYLRQLLHLNSQALPYLQLPLGDFYLLKAISALEKSVRC